MGDRITIKGRDGAFGAYLAAPIAGACGGRAPGVVRRERGHPPDLRRTGGSGLHRGRARPVLAAGARRGPRREVRADWQHGLRLYRAYDRDAARRDVKDTVAQRRKLPDCTGKVAVLGYCLGALMTFLTAARYSVDAAVAYHGGDTEKYLDEVGWAECADTDAPRRGRRVHLQTGAGRNKGGAGPESRTRRCTATPANATRSRGTTGPLQRRQRPRSPTVAHTTS